MSRYTIGAKLRVDLPFSGNVHKPLPMFVIYPVCVEFISIHDSVTGGIGSDASVRILLNRDIVCVGDILMYEPFSSIRKRTGDCSLCII